MMGGRWRLGRSGDEGDDQPGWDIMPQCGVACFASLVP